jgi:hypothetical protein
MACDWVRELNIFQKLHFACDSLDLGKEDDGHLMMIRRITPMARHETKLQGRAHGLRFGTLAQTRFLQWPLLTAATDEQSAMTEISLESWRSRYAILLALFSFLPR